MPALGIHRRRFPAGTVVLRISSSWCRCRLGWVDRARISGKAVSGLSVRWAIVALYREALYGMVRILRMVFGVAFRVRSVN